MDKKRLFQKIEQSRLCKNMPAKTDARHFADDLIDFLFPFRKNQANSLGDATKWQILHDQLQQMIQKMEGFSIENAADLSQHFFQKIPFIYEKLQADAEEILLNDPAAQSVEEVILAYPGFYAIAVYRLAKELYEQKIPILPRLMSEYAHSETGIDIHPGATIGTPFFIDHGTGIVIGETTLIGDFVKIYQGVTLGALMVRKSDAQIKRHPTIENHVTIYANATILGGKTVIGHDSLIGGNVFLTTSVLPHSTVYQKSEIKIRQQEDFLEVLDFCI